MKVPRFIRKRPIYQTIRSSALGKKYLIRERKLIPQKELNKVHAEGKALTLDSSIEVKPVVGIVYPKELITGYVTPKASVYLYERYCKTNHIEYRSYDIHASDWLKQAKDLDIIFWHVNSIPTTLYEAESKIYVLEKICGKTCFPSYHEIWQYEDKCRAHYLYQAYKLPCIPTITSNSKDELIGLANTIDYPVIVKTKTGAGSYGVRKISKKKQLKRYIRKVFSQKGCATIYPYERQKDYLLIQEFIKAEYDLRIKIVGNKAFGFYRYPNKGDFRASGTGNKEYSRPISTDLIREAIEIKEALNSRILGIDFLYSEKYKRHLIIEASTFNSINSPAVETCIDGIPGFYDISDPSNIHYKEGSYWVPELVAELVITDWIKHNNS